MFFPQVESGEQLGRGQGREGVPPHDFWLVQGEQSLSKTIELLNLYTPFASQEFVFEIVVDKKLVPKEVLENGNILILCPAPHSRSPGELEPVVLPAWDPLGALAI